MGIAVDVEKPHTNDIHVRKIFFYIANRSHICLLALRLHISL